MRWAINFLILVFMVTIGCGCEKEATFEGKKTSSWVSDLKSGSPRVRLAAINALMQIKSNDKMVVQALTRVGVYSNNKEAQELALEALGGITENSESGILICLEAQNHSKSIVAERGIDCLRVLGRTADLSKLVKLVKEEQRGIDEAFANIGPRAVEAVPKLIPMVETGNIQAINALGLIGPGAKEAVPSLIEEFKTGESKNPGSYSSIRSMISLGKIGPASAEVVPMVLEMAKRGVESGEGAHLPIIVLGNIGLNPEDVVPVLILALDGRDQSVAVVALGQFGSEAKDAIPKLKELWRVYNRLSNTKQIQQLKIALANSLQQISGKRVIEDGIIKYDAIRQL